MLKLHKPYLGKEEKILLNQVLESGDISGDGEMERLFKKDLKRFFKVKYAIATSSGTNALELAVASLGLGEGDEVLVPSFTYPADATAVLLQGAKVKFVDIDPVFFNIDVEKIKQAITSKTRAIIVVHYAGMNCDMDKIMPIAKKFKLKVIEDACHCWGAKYKGKMLGTIGDIGCFSLHSTKNITSGEGGVLITNNRQIYDKAEIYRQVGTNRHLLIEGKISKYQWITKGSSYYLSSLQAAVARAQLKKVDEITKKRNNIANLYLKFLDNIPQVVLPKVPKGCKPNWHIFAILVPEAKKIKLIKFLKSKGIETAFHFYPLHASIMGRKLGYKADQLPVSSQISKTLIRLPIYPGLSNKDIAYIAENIKQFFQGLT